MTVQADQNASSSTMGATQISSVCVSPTEKTAWITIYGSGFDPDKENTVLLETSGGEASTLKHRIETTAISPTQILFYLPSNFKAESYNLQVQSHGHDESDSLPVSVVMGTKCTTENKIIDVPSPNPLLGADSQAIQCAINQATQYLLACPSKHATVTLQDKATYHLTPRDDSYDALTIRPAVSTLDTLYIPKIPMPTLNHFSLDGKNATLLLPLTTGGIEIVGCNACEISNLTLQAESRIETQGKVVDVDVDNNSVDMVIPDGLPVLTLDEGYRSRWGRNGNVLIFHLANPNGFPNKLSYDSNQSIPPYLFISEAKVDPDDSTRLHLTLTKSKTCQPAPLPCLSDSKTTLLKASMKHLKALFNEEKEIYAAFAISPSDESLYDGVKSRHDVIKSQLVKIPNRGNLPFPNQFFLGAAGPAIYATVNSDLQLKNITIGNHTGIGVLLNGNTGPITVDGIKIIPLSSGALLSIKSDGLDAHNNRVGPTIKNSRIENTGDDAINLMSVPLYAKTLPISRKQVHLKTNTFVPIYKNDWFFLTDLRGQSLGTFQVTEVKYTTMSDIVYEYTVTFADNPKQPFPYASISKPSHPVLFVDLGASNQGAEVKNNLIMGTQRLGIYVSSGVTIKNNVFANLGGSAINYMFLGINKMSGMNNLGSLDFDGTKKVNIDGNTIINVSGHFLHIGSKSLNPDIDSLELKGLVVTNNHIYNPSSNPLIFWNSRQMPMPIDAYGNEFYIAEDTNIPRKIVQIIGDRQWPSSPNLPSLKIEPAMSADELWVQECRATNIWHLCSSSP